MKCLFSINICDIVFYAFFNFFWNVPRSAAIKICYIIDIHIQSYPMKFLSSAEFILYAPSFFCDARVFTTGKLFLEETTLNLGSF